MSDPERFQEETTFGLELEFLIPLPPTPPHSQPTTTSYQYRKSLGNLAICNTINRHTNIPLAVECHHTPSQPCAICQLAASKGNQEPFEDSIFNIIGRENSAKVLGMSPRTEYFHVDFECVYALPCDKWDTWLGLEVRTAVFTPSEVRMGLPKLASCVEALKKGEHELQINDTCGMHIHVGLTSGMTLLVAKKLVTLVILIEEPFLRAVIPKLRRMKDATAPVATESQLAKGVDLPEDVVAECLHEPELTSQMISHLPPSSLTRLSLIKHSPKDIRQTLTRLWQLRSLYDLEDALANTNGFRCGLAFCLRRADGKICRPSDYSLYRAQEEKMRPKQMWEHSPSSLEFRYPEMSFDIEMMRVWVEVVEKIMGVARLDEVEFQGVLRGVLVDLNEEGEVWAALLKRLGLGNQMPFWKAYIMDWKDKEKQARNASSKRGRK